MARLPKAVYFVPFLLLALVSFAQTAPPSRILQAIDNAQFTPVHGSAHPMARPAFDRGPVDGSMQLNNVTMVFKPSAVQQQAINTLLAEQQDRTSPKYHKWLTPQQTADLFGMAPDDLAKVSTWLTSQGFTINFVAGSCTHISFSGTAAQIASAFHAQIHQYEVNGESHFANANALSVPAAFSSLVLGFRGLSNFRPKPRTSMVRHTSGAPRLNASAGQHLLAPEDFATIYDVKALYDAGFDGTGESIAVVGQTAVTMSDITNFRSAAGLSTNNPTVVVVPTTGTPVYTGAGDLGESDLDLEWSGAVAKNATILFVTVGPQGDVFDSLFWALDPSLTSNLPPLAPVVSISYGACEAANGLAFAQEVQQFVQSANAQGTTVTAAAGDQGAADCDDNVDETVAVDGLAVDVPAAVPEVTGVGGTEFSADKTAPATYWSSTQDVNSGSALQYIPEGIWNDTAQQGVLVAGGGGKSTFFAVPSWQSGTAGLLAGGRNVPDVALNASNGHDPYVFCSTPPGTLADCTTEFANSSDELDAVGGTSAGAPTFAGIVALLDQAIDSAGLGNVNAGLYPQLGAAPNSFHDVTTGNNIVPCTSGTPTTGPVALRCPTTTPFQIGYTAAAGYDQVSGLGSVDAFNLVTGWPGYSAVVTYSVAGTPVTVASAGDMGTSTITLEAVNGFNGTVNLTCTPPTGTSVTISCSIPASVAVTGASATATLTITTANPHAVLASSSAPNRPRGMGWFAVSGGGLLAGILVMGVPSRRRKGTAMFGIVLLAFAVTGIGCGGGSSSTPPPVSPTGNFTVGVTAVSGSITRTLNIAVTVN